uniref:Uncharacterized protein n=1 Tax=Avena sativa TaxID=4498 RepID=A0ACD5ZMK2_AVESA
MPSSTIIATRKRRRVPVVPPIFSPLRLSLAAFPLIPGGNFAPKKLLALHINSRGQNFLSCLQLKEAATRQQTMSMEAGRTIPKFGQWDVNNPASADGFTVIFSKARDEKNAPVNAHKATKSADSKDARTEKMNSYNNNNNNNSRANASKKWFCCVSPSPTQP